MINQKLDKRKAKLVPTLDGENWMVHGAQDKLDRLLAHFFTTDAAQSTLYYNEIATFQSISADNAGDIGLLREEMEDYLTRYLSKYFDNIQVNVFTTDTLGTIKDINELDTNVVGIRLEIEFIDDDEFIQFKKDLYYTEKGIFHYVLDKFNTGA